MKNLATIAGVDGCPGGWLCITLDTESGSFCAKVVSLAADLLACEAGIHVTAIDMPIGLSNNGRRRCDELARQLLGRRHVCVSNAPIRPALYAPSRLAAAAVTRAAAGRDVGAQEWALYSKIINLDIAITPEHQNRCFEMHPELSFRAWNSNQPIEHAKATADGMSVREALIEEQWPGAHALVLGQLKKQRLSAMYYARDDVNDAFAALWTAQRITRRLAERIPDEPEVDARGLRMEMWF